MNNFDDEVKILEHLQHTQPNFVLWPDFDPDTKSILMDLYDIANGAEWINSSRKSDPPPDFYSDKACLMMEVMRIDDHTRPGKKGKPFNPVNIRESQLQKELDKVFPGIPKFINAISDYKGIVDHNYKLYIKNFRTTVERHIKRVPQYRINHPKHRLIFYVFDESSAYIESANKKIASKGIREGQAILCKKHVHYLDKNMLFAFRESNVDFLLWHTPFKTYFNESPTRQMPQVAFIKLNNFQWEMLHEYNEDLMMSVEE